MVKGVDMDNDKSGAGKNQQFYNKSRAFIPPEVLASPAYLTITSAKTHIVLVRFWQKAFHKQTKKRKGGAKSLTITNNGQIIFTYGEAAALGISAATFHKAVKDLLARGFIDISENGNWYQKQPTKFFISWRFLKYGQPDFEKMGWKRGLPAGLGFQKKTKHALESKSQQALASQSQKADKVKTLPLEYESQKKRQANSANT